MHVPADPPQWEGPTTALLLLYYIFTTNSLLIYYGFTAALLLLYYLQEFLLCGSCRQRLGYCFTAVLLLLSYCFTTCRSSSSVGAADSALAEATGSSSPSPPICSSMRTHM